MMSLGLSILLGFIVVLLASLLGVNGSKVNGNFVFAVWLIGFLSPSIFVLGEIYED